MYKACVLWILVCCLLGAPLSADAQMGSQTVVSGTVRDGSGEVVPGVTLTLRPLEAAGTTQTALTDARGAYTFDGLPPGAYDLRAVLSGFNTETTRVSARAGQTQTVDLTLRIAPLSETVTVTRDEQDLAVVPSSVTAIQGPEIQSLQRRASPAEALSGIPGIFVENRRNFSLSGGLQLALRSPLPRFGIRGIQIVQDGVPLTMADGTTEPTNIDLGSVGRIEVLRGPSSVLYGNSAGGVVSLRTEFPTSDRLVIQPDVQFGSHGYQQQQVKVSGTAGRVSYLMNASHLESDGFRTHSRAEVNRANMILRAALSPNTEIQGVFNVYDLPFGQSANTLTLEQARDEPRSVRPQALTQGWGESTTQGQGGVTLEHRFDNGQSFRATGWGLWRDVFNPIPFAVIQLQRSASGLRTEYRGSALMGVPVSWTTGVDVSSQRDDRLESENDGVGPGGGLTRVGATQIEQREEVLSVGPFAQLRAELGPRWMLTGGVRYDIYKFSAVDHFTSDGDQSGDRLLDAVSPMAGVTFSATDQLNLYTSFATSYQTPTTVELSNRPTGGGGFNEDLEPEDLRTFEVGVRGVIDRWHARFELTGYVSRLENALVQFTRADEATFFRNAGEASRDGIEALVEWTPAPRFSTRLAYTYQNFRFTRFVAPEGDFSGNKEPGVPPHQLFAGVRYDTPFGLRTAFEVRSIEAYPVNSTNTISNWAYQVANVRVGLDQRWNGINVRPFVGIDNLFGERYNASTITNSLGGRFFEPAPGREIYVGLTIGAPVF